VLDDRGKEEWLFFATENGRC